MTNFGFETTGQELAKHFADQVQGRIFVITGPSAGGLGAETAISLAHAAPAALILLGRSLERAQPTIDAVRAVDAAIDVRFLELDLSLLASVRAVADQLLADASLPRIDVLINNAAVMACPFALTPDGFELQLASNHLGHFALTNRLLPKLRAAAAAGGAARPRVVNVSSAGSRLGGMRWDDPNFAQPGSYTAFAAYGQSKTANVLFTIALNRRLAAAGAGVRAYAVHPGSVMTPLARHMKMEEAVEVAKTLMGPDPATWKQKTPQQGCATTLRAALDPALEKEEGVFLSDCQLTTDAAVVAPWALDAADAERLWPWTEELVGEKFAL